MGALELVGKVMKAFSPPEKRVATFKGMQNVIGFFGPKENAGTTTFCVNAAEILASKGRSVCILDLNFKSHDVLNYFAEPEEESGIRSILEWFKNKSIPIAEFFLRPKRYPKITIVTADVTTTPDQYFSIESEDVSELIKDLKEVFNYVLIDAGYDVNDGATYAGLSESSIVFGFIQPSVGSIDEMSILNQFLGKSALVDKLQNVIQNLVHSQRYGKEELSGTGLNYSGLCVFSDEVYREGCNYALMTEKKKVQTVSGKQFVNLIENLVEVILNNEAEKDERISVDGKTS